MPVVNIDAAWLNELLEKTYPTSELSDALDQIGCDVEDVVQIERFRCPACAALVEASFGTDTVKVCSVCGHSQEEPFDKVDELEVIRLDLLAARPDLFDIGGLARALKGYLGEKQGLPEVGLAPPTLTVEVDPAVEDERSYRPFIACAVLTMPALDDRSLAAVMKLQENLHWGVGRDRKLASIGVYDMSTFEGPVHYTTLDPDNDEFEPLGMPGKRMSGRRILEEHPKGTAYAHLLDGLDRYPVLRDAQGNVLSMPPIINSEQTKVRKGSTRLFVDVTGVSAAAVDNALNTLVFSLLELGAKIEQVNVIKNGQSRQTPHLEPREVEITLQKSRQWIGVDLTSEQLVHSLKRMRLSVKQLDEQGTRFRVGYPAFRSDIRHMVDVFEDLAIGYGYQKIQPALVPTMTVGGPRPEEALSESARTVMLGLGFNEIMSLPMTTEQEHYERLRLPVPDDYPRVGNPKLKALTVVREHLMSGLMLSLRENRRRPMPLRMFELDNVVRLDEHGLNGTREERHLCFVEMGPDAGFATARAYVDSLLRELGEEGTYETTTHPTFTEGRVATFKAGPFSGIIGEVHPEVIVGFGLDHPVALVELNLMTIDTAVNARLHPIRELTS